MGFKAADAVSALDYDLSPHADVKGTVPEPSSKAVTRFIKRLSNAARTVGYDVADAADADEVRRIYASMSEEDMDKIQEENLDAVAELTQGHPTRDELEAAGHRTFQAFLGWLVGELNNPEGSTSATRPSLRAVSGG